MKSDETSLTIRQVANGWVVTGKSPSDILHMAVDAEQLAKYVAMWANETVKDQDKVPAALVSRQPIAIKA
jgi:hypothetical protein